MFKWLTRHAPARRGLFRLALLPMPERLLEIAAVPARFVQVAHGPA